MHVNNIIVTQENEGYGVVHITKRKLTVLGKGGVDWCSSPSSAGPPSAPSIGAATVSSPVSGLVCGASAAWEPSLTDAVSSAALERAEGTLSITRSSPSATASAPFVGVFSPSSSPLAVSSGNSGSKWMDKKHDFEHIIKVVILSQWNNNQTI